MRIAIHDFVGHPFQFQLSRELARQGHEVGHFFLADYPGAPGHNTVRVDDPAQLTIRGLSLGGGYRTDRFVSRGLNNIRYGRMLAREIEAFAPDVVLSGNTPLEAQHFLIGASRRAGAAFVLWVQDFYGLAVSTLLRNRWFGVGKLIGNVYLAMERAQASASDGVVFISPGFMSETARLGIDTDRVAVIPNWGALDDIPLRPKVNAWSKAHGLDEKRVVLYSGTLGLKHNPELILALADGLANDPAVTIVVAAEGSGKTALTAALDAQPRANVLTLPLQQAAVFPDMLGAADVTIALLEEDAGRFSVPSKILSYMCAGRPIVMAAPKDNLSSEIVVRSGAGACVSPRAPADFVAAVSALMQDTNARAAMSAASRRYAEENFQITRVAPRFMAVFESAIVRRNRRTSAQRDGGLPHQVGGALEPEVGQNAGRKVER